MAFEKLAKVFSKDALDSISPTRFMEPEEERIDQSTPEGAPGYTSDAHDPACRLGFDVLSDQ